MQKILIYGYGNPGRQDDGLGPRFIELCDAWIREQNLTNMFTDTNYQLNIEDAAEIAGYDTVVFVDASVVEDLENFKLETVEPDDARIEFTMHAVSVSYVVDLCQKIYNKSPKACVLHIRGYEYDFKEELTPKAAENMHAAFAYLKDFFKQVRRNDS